MWKKNGKINVKKFIPVILTAGVLFYLWSENVPAANMTEINVPESLVGAKIVQISDGHGRIVPDRIMDSIRSFSPDVIVLTGDMIDKSTKDAELVISNIVSLSRIAPLFFIPGNHERANPKGEAFIKLVGKSGAEVLLNDAEKIATKEKNMIVCGVDDINLNLDNVRKAVSAKGKCDILLSHSPVIWERLSGFNIPLVLSGHTHGGQIRIPLFGAVFLPDNDIPPDLIRGVSVRNGTRFHVSVGFGTSVIPLRFMNRAEIDFITLISE